MDFTKAQLEAIYTLIEELDGCGLVITDDSLLRKEMGLPESVDDEN